MKQVPNSPNYCITLDGKLFSLTRMKYVQPSYDRDGYVFYRMSYKSREFQKRAHRLVAMTYLPNPLNKNFCIFNDLSIKWVFIFDNIVL